MGSGGAIIYIRDNPGACRLVYKGEMRILILLITLSWSGLAAQSISQVDYKVLPGILTLRDQGTHFAARGVENGDHHLGIPGNDVLNPGALAKGVGVTGADVQEQLLRHELHR